MYKYKFCSTYGYFYTSIGYVTLTGDLNKYKYKFCSTYGYFRISISWVTSTGDLYKYKSAISIGICTSLLYEFMMNPDICYCYMFTEKEYECMCVYISYMFPLSVKLNTGF